jgi:hypothetical protein
VFNTDVTVYEPKIKRVKNATKMEHIHFFLSSNNASGMAEVLSKDPGKCILKIVETVKRY